jgi:hypothetical protein
MDTLLHQAFLVVSAQLASKLDFKTSKNKNVLKQGYNIGYDMSGQDLLK